MTLTYADEDHVHAPDTGGGGYTYDANGNLAVKEYAELFTFDAENRLAQNRWYSAFELQDNHLYNGHGERVRVRMWSDTWAVGDTHDLFMDGVYEENGLHCATASNNVRYYTAFGRIIAQRKTLANGTSTLLYFMADHLGSKVGTIDASSGAVSTIKYWPFGKVRSGNVSTARRYTGQRWEQSATSTMEAYFYNARFYSPKTAHFMSADSVVSELNGPSLNRLAYAVGNPVNRVDPSGNSPRPPIGSEQCAGALECLTAAGLTSDDIVRLSALPQAWTEWVDAWGATGTGYSGLPFSIDSVDWLYALLLYDFNHGTSLATQVQWDRFAIIGLTADVFFGIVGDDNRKREFQEYWDGVHLWYWLRTVDAAISLQAGGSFDISTANWSEDQSRILQDASRRDTSSSMVDNRSIRMSGDCGMRSTSTPVEARSFIRSDV